MSAFLCSNDHIMAMVRFAVARRFDFLNVEPRYLGLQHLDKEKITKVASTYANILLVQNLRSVSARYKGAHADQIEFTYRDVIDAALPPVAILKLCDCFDYQASETDDYETTQAAKLVQAIRNAAIHALPGYDAEPWSYTKGETS